jgi:HAD superfamily hydrolase (TIGR01484 family)
MGQHDIKLIVLDMDGTLLHVDGHVSEMNKKWIAQARKAGIEVTLASGRHIHYVKETMLELALTMPVVTNNGCEIWTSEGVLVNRYTLSVEQICVLHSLALKFGTAFRAYAVGNDYQNEAFRVGREQDYSWLMFMFRIRSAEIGDQIWAELTSLGQFELSMAGPAKLDVNPLNVNKAKGIAEICDQYGLASHQVAAIGDGLNDIALLQWAGLGIAMNNAADEVKAVADWITANFHENGVAQAIQKILK